MSTVSAEVAMISALQGNIAVVRNVSDAELIGMSEALSVAVHLNNDPRPNVHTAYDAVHIEILRRMQG